MSFCAYRIALIGNQENPYYFAGTNQNGQIVEEKWDNGLNRVLKGSQWTFLKYKTDPKKDSKIIVSLGLGDVSNYFTDSRVVTLNRKYDQGSISWEFVSSDKSDKKKFKGKVLLGQVRYEWLHKIAFSRKTGVFSIDSVSLIYSDGDSYYDSVIVLPKGTDTEFLANDILHRACKYRLAMKDKKSEHDMEFFRRYSESGKIGTPADPKETPSIILPNSYYAPLGEEFRPDI